MAIISITTALALAASCQSVVAPATIVDIAKHESRLDAAAVNRNRDGSIDVGLMQINSANWSWLGLTGATALDPCQSIAAAARLLASYSRYNSGSPTRGLPYALAVTAHTHPVDVKAPLPDAPPRGSPFSRPAHTGRELVFNTTRSTP
ncbi:MAG: hypothetical protein NVS4B8_23710 [Herpetosiphon sp.]